MGNCNLTILIFISMLSLLKVAPDCDDFILACEFNGVKFNCSRDFQVVVTDYGFCCSFNIVPYAQEIKDKARTPQNLDLDDEPLSVPQGSSPGMSKPCPETALETGDFETVCESYQGRLSSSQMTFALLKAVLS